MEIFQLVTFVFAGRYIQRSSAIVPWLWCFLAGTQPSTPKKLLKSIPFMKGRFWKWKSELELLRIGENTHQKSVAQPCVSRMSWRKPDTFWLKFGGKWLHTPWNWRFSCGRMGGSSSPRSDPQEIPSRTTPSSSFSAKGSTKSFCSWCNSSTNSRRGEHGNCGSQRGRVQDLKTNNVSPWKKVEKRSFPCEMAPF